MYYLNTDHTMEGTVIMCNENHFNSQFLPTCNSITSKLQFITAVQKTHTGHHTDSATNPISSDYYTNTVPFQRLSMTMFHTQDFADSQVSTIFVQLYYKIIRKINTLVGILVVLHVLMHWKKPSFTIYCELHFLTYIYFYLDFYSKQEIKYNFKAYRSQIFHTQISIAEKGENLITVEANN